MYAFTGIWADGSGGHYVSGGSPMTNAELADYLATDVRGYIVDPGSMRYPQHRLVSFTVAHLGGRHMPGERSGAT